jgi:4-hydroxy-2-oxoheptanedioate aldolase
MLTAWVGLPDPLVAGVLAREDFDAVVLDMQHGAFDIATAIPAIAQVALAGKPAIVRIPVDQFPIASRLLDNGASGIIAPMINSKADAEAFASFAKFPPMGDRSWGPSITLNMLQVPPNDYLRDANGMALTFAMIETREAVAALDDILGVPGIDAILVGPGDLSIALSDGAHFDMAHPSVRDAMAHILSRVKAHGKKAAVFGPTPTIAAGLARDGWDLIALGTDIMQLRSGVKAVMAEYRAG